MSPTRSPSSAKPGSDGGRRRSPSLERRLPLIITALLAVTLGASLGLIYLAVRDTVETVAAGRLQNATRELGNSASLAIATNLQRYGARASAAPVRQLLASGAAGQPLDTAEVRTALSQFIAQNDSTLPVELWTRDGRRVAFIGNDLRPPQGVSGEEAGVLPHLGLSGAEIRDSAVVGPLYVENGAVYYWFVVPVRAGGQTRGHVAVQRRILAAPALDDRIRRLVGDSVNAYYVSLDRALWTTVEGEPVPEPSSPGRLVAVDTIERMPAMLVLRQPQRVVLAPVRATFARLGKLYVLVLLFGAAGAWLLSRRITRPLSTLTRAAESMAAGDYASRVEEQGHEEIVRLAASFNHLAATVDSSRAELEAQVGAARAMASELETSNHRLQETNARIKVAMEEAGRAREEAEEARLHAEAANRAKSDFLAVMSHELRTPLNAIGGYAELMELGIRGPITESQRRDLERIRASQEHLLGLISAMLDLSRIETGQVHYDLVPILLAPFLAGLDALVEPQAEAKSLHLTPVSCPADLAAVADREKLRQVLLNLLSNAIRYTLPGGRITLAAAATGDGQAAITVRDTGIGIPPDELQRIFEPFVQLDRSLTKVRDGVGLGLAISRDLARAMGGELTVESTVGEGSLFTLTLPIAPAASACPVVITGEFDAARR